MQKNEKEKASRKVEPFLLLKVRFIQ